MGKAGCRVGNGVKLVYGKYDAGYPKQVHQQRMAAGLGQQFQRRVLPVEFGGVDQHHGGIGAAGCSDHVAGVLQVARCVANDELAAGGAEITVGHVNRDALFALGAEPVGEQRQIGFATLGDAGQMVQHDRAAVHQQAANQRAFAIIYRATGDEFKGRAGV